MPPVTKISLPHRKPLLALDKSDYLKAFPYTDLKSLLLSLYFGIVVPTVADIPNFPIIYLKIHDIIHLHIFFSGEASTA